MGKYRHDPFANSEKKKANNDWIEFTPTIITK
ncbi:unnamed protein product, partial [Rotaria magnacalcarata]